MLFIIKNCCNRKSKQRIQFKERMIFFSRAIHIFFGAKQHKMFSYFSFLFHSFFFPSSSFVKQRYHCSPFFAFDFVFHGYFPEDHADWPGMVFKLLVSVCCFEFQQRCEKEHIFYGLYCVLYAYYSIDRHNM